MGFRICLIRRSATSVSMRPMPLPGGAAVDFRQRLNGNTSRARSLCKGIHSMQAGCIQQRRVGPRASSNCLATAGNGRQAPTRAIPDTNLSQVHWANTTANSCPVRWSSGEARASLRRIIFVQPTATSFPPQRVGSSPEYVWQSEASIVTTISPAVDLVCQSALEARTELIREVQNGLHSRPRSLKPWMLYDELGSRLFEEITALPEYYPTRTERSLLESRADAIVASACAHSQPLRVVELGAGTASKTCLLLAAAARRRVDVVYMPLDVSADALEIACRGIESA